MRSCLEKPTETKEPARRNLCHAIYTSWQQAPHKRMVLAMLCDEMCLHTHMLSFSRTETLCFERLCFCMSKKFCFCKARALCVCVKVWVSPPFNRCVSCCKTSDIALLYHITLHCCDVASMLFRRCIYTIFATLFWWEFPKTGFHQQPPKLSSRCHAPMLVAVCLLPIASISRPRLAP